MENMFKDALFPSFGVTSHASQHLDEKIDLPALNTATQLTLFRLIVFAFKQQVFNTDLTWFEAHNKTTNSHYTIRSEDDLAFLIRENPLRHDYIISQCSADSEPLIIENIRGFWSDIFSPAYTKKHPNTSAQELKSAYYQLINIQHKESTIITKRRLLEVKINHHAKRFDNAWSWLQSIGKSPNSDLVIDRMLAPHFNALEAKSTKTEKSLENALNRLYKDKKIIELDVIALATADCKYYANHASISPRSYFKQNFPDEYLMWQEALKAQHLDDSHYVPLLIHPRQKKLIATELSDAINKQKLILLDNVKLRGHSFSERALLEPIQRHSPSIKLPFRRKATKEASFSTFKENFTVSQLLEKALRKDQKLASLLRVCRTTLRIYACDHITTAENRSNAAQLNMLYQEHADNLLKNGETKIRTDIAFAPSPFSDQMIISDIMSAYGATTPEKAKEYLAHYMRMMVEGKLAMYVKHGIKLGDNDKHTYLVFDEQGGLKSLLIEEISKDAEIYEPTMDLNDISIDKNRKDYIKKISSDEFHTGDMMKTIFDHDLLPFIEEITNHFGIPQEELEFMLVHMIEELIDSLKKQQSNYGKKKEQEAQLRMLQSVRATLFQQSFYPQILQTIATSNIQSQSNNQIIAQLDNAVMGNEKWSQRLETQLLSPNGNNKGDGGKGGGIQVA